MTKIIHCADLHLDSPMETHMTEEQASIRNTEIIHTFLRLTEYAAKNDVRAVIIAGDMFDGERIKIRTVDEILDGFPRTGARNIVENERKRYDPWQGGKYGGYLEFEIQDTSYRVTRYFGKTAAKDTFSLLDLTSRRPSEAYSEKLGEELFRLDADSFARSTYVPQLSASDVGATTSIRRKLMQRLKGRIRIFGQCLTNIFLIPPTGMTL